MAIALAKPSKPILTPQQASRGIREVSPKNGSFPIILLAGGPGDRARELRDLFAVRRGALVKYHWEYQSPRAFQKPIPLDVDLVILLRTMLGHHEGNAVRIAARKVDVPVVMTSHKWSVLDNAVRQRVKMAKAPPLDLRIHSTSYLREEDDTPKPAETAQVAPPPPPAPLVEPPGVIRIGPTLEERAEEIVAKHPGAHASVETLAMLLAVQLRMRLEGLSNVLLSPAEITINVAPT